MEVVLGCERGYLFLFFFFRRGGRGFGSTRRVYFLRLRIVGKVGFFGFSLFFLEAVRVVFWELREGGYRGVAAGLIKFVVFYRLRAEWRFIGWVVF